MVDVSRSRGSKAKRLFHRGFLNGAGKGCGLDGVHEKVRKLATIDRTDDLSVTLACLCLLCQGNGKRICLPHMLLCLRCEFAMFQPSPFGRLPLVARLNGELEPSRCGDLSQHGLPRCRLLLHSRPHASNSAVARGLSKVPARRVVFVFRVEGDTSPLTSTNTIGHIVIILLG